MLRGFGNTQSAPHAMKCLLSSGNTLPVTPMMGRVCPASRRVLVASGPFITGISKSMMMRSKGVSGEHWLTLSRHSLPLYALVTSMPAFFSSRVRILTEVIASSTTRTRLGVSDAASPDWSCDRELARSKNCPELLRTALTLAAGSSTGTVTVKVDPLPRPSDSTLMAPPCWLIISRDIHSPKPLPWPACRSLGLNCTPSWNSDFC
mmetsp:Transcript_15709/g.26188  ORF Transcript_15709/g.26188 Transcript_15709/m.26188 type:complete len:206 (-) Transcript_15709:2206-2823(-)